jgi:hypothetical protein
MRDYHEVSMTQIILYGASDPLVRSTLHRLVAVLSMLELSDEAQHIVAAFADEIGAADAAE